MTAELATIRSNTDIAESRDVSTQAMVFDPDVIAGMMRMADMMSKAVVTVPKHLTGNPADCLAIIMQAAQWRLNPFATAQKTHLVNGVLGYEAQLVNAVIQQSGVIRGRFHYEYDGDGANVSCRVGAIPTGESEIQWGEWLSAAQVTTKNSPLWKTNPKQQLGYLQVKNWARQYAPGALLGVYSVDELRDSEPMEHNMGQANVVTDPPSNDRTADVKAKLTARVSKPAPTGPTLDDVLQQIAAADDMAALKAVPAAKLASDADKVTARDAYKARAAEIKAAAKPVDPEPLDLTPPTLVDSLIAAAATATSDEDRSEILDAARELSEADSDRIAAAFPA